MNQDNNLRLCTPGQDQAACPPLVQPETPTAPLPSELAHLAEQWDNLPEAVKAAVAALAAATGSVPGKGEGKRAGHGG